MLFAWMMATCFDHKSYLILGMVVLSTEAAYLLETLLESGQDIFSRSYRLSNSLKMSKCISTKVEAARRIACGALKFIFS